MSIKKWFGVSIIMASLMLPAVSHSQDKDDNLSDRVRELERREQQRIQNDPIKEGPRGGSDVQIFHGIKPKACIRYCPGNGAPCQYFCD